MSTALQDLIDTDPEWKRRYELIRTLGDESERGMAVLVGAELDRALALVLHAYLAPGKARKELFGGGASPLGSFSSKIDLCRALQLIDEAEYSALHIIRKIRNEFAHNPSISFASPDIRSRIDALSSRRRDGDHKYRFEIEAAELIAAIEVAAVDQAHGRVYEESYSTWYRRGVGRDVEPFASKEEAALAYADRQPR
jgi:hypothetical protein